MRKSIVLKMFTLLTFFLLLLLLSVGIVQDYLFKQYYVNSKIDTLREYIEAFEEAAEHTGVEAASRAFFTSDRVWITKLDKFGRIYDVESHYMMVEMRDGSQDILKIPMYSFEGYFANAELLFAVGDEVMIDFLILDEERVSYQIQTNSRGVVNLSIAEKLHGISADAAYQHFETSVAKGIVIATNFSDQADSDVVPYGERFFIEQIKAFQINIIGQGLNSQNTMEGSIVNNLVEYRVAAKPLLGTTDIEYIFGMISLQPVDEALAVFRQFYPYFLGTALLSIVAFAYVLSRKLSRPLLAFNRITRKIANRDFSEKLPVHSHDEIGQLAQSINILAERLEVYIGQLESDLEKEKLLETARREFIAEVSHELKTPLAVMKSCLSILEDGVAPKKSDHYFQALEAEVHRMDTLIQNMLDLAKFKSGTYRPEITPFDIAEVVSDACEVFSAPVQAKGVVLRTVSRSQMVLGHRGLISRVMTNFLNNALRHTEKGGVITVIVQLHSHSEPNAEGAGKSEKEKERGSVTISVENQGPSIMEENLKRVWDQFYRIDTHKKESGAGLGLSISKEILELHRVPYGVINTGEGVRFYFSLPVQ